MTTEYILYGLKKDEPEYMEDIIFETKNKKDLEDIKFQAIQKGYIKFRVAEYKGEAPNFNNHKLINMEVIKCL